MTEKTETTAQAPGLTIQDLTLTVQVIQVASSRGAFKAEEMSAVGGLYDRLYQFLNAAGAITPAPEPEAAAPSPVVTETAKKVKV